jgi:hypothetical protein
MDGDGPGANGAAAGVGANGALNGGGKRKGRKFYVGDDGVGVWRAGMEVDNFMLDGVGESPGYRSREIAHVTAQCTTPNPRQTSYITFCTTDSLSTRQNTP